MQGVNCRANGRGKPRAVSANWLLWSFPGGNYSQHYAYTLSEREQFATDKNRVVIRQFSNTRIYLTVLWHLTVPKNHTPKESVAHRVSSRYTWGLSADLVFWSTLNLLSEDYKYFIRFQKEVGIGFISVRDSSVISSRNQFFFLENSFPLFAVAIFHSWQMPVPGIFSATEVLA